MIVLVSRGSLVLGSRGSKVGAEAPSIVRVSLEALGSDLNQVKVGACLLTHMVCSKVDHVVDAQGRGSVNTTVRVVFPVHLPFLSFQKVRQTDVPAVIVLVHIPFPFLLVLSSCSRRERLGTF